MPIFAALPGAHGVLRSLATFAVACAALPAHAGETSLYYAAPTSATLPSPAARALGEAAKVSPKAELSPKIGSSKTEPPQERVCFNSAETRERVTSQKLTEPFQALQTGNLQGEALRAKLCRWTRDEFVYEIAVLRYDGHIVHVYMNAQNGRAIDR